MFALLIFLTPCANTYGERKECLQYEPAIVTLKGKAYKESFIGPPNYESIESGDTPSSEIIIKLDHPICVIAEANDEMNETVYDVKEIQIDTDSIKNFEELLRTYKGVINKKVIATGSLYNAILGFHRRKVVLETSNLKLANTQSKAIIDEIDKKCFQYEPVTVALEGLLYKVHFPVVPENLTKQEQDKLFTAWILIISDHICVTEQSNNNLNEPEYDVMQIQLQASTASNIKLTDDISGKKVAITGKLSHSKNTDWVWRNVLMRVEKLKIIHNK
ncbi:hypothetical protein MCHI_000624 [Candidatus Magnetoovum chiemensis]|nr:hypothetical protein MCHI_000624 [Candidatus Magnetoovum chiemensis]